MIKQIAKETVITCLFGDPVAQSVSPYMYGYFAKRTGIEYYSHLKIRVPKEKKGELGEAILAAKTLGFAGINITVPYKMEVIKELDKVDSRAKTIGAVNAILVKDGKLTGYNTDGLGALAAMENRLRKMTQKDKVVVFGAGGASRAILGTLLPITKNITVLQRKDDFNLAHSLKKSMKKVNILPLNFENISKSVIRANFVLNATSVGMIPNTRESVILEKLFSEINRKAALRQKFFFDTVYNPYETKFLSLAKKYGAKLCQGLYMMAYQGAASFELWTGKKVAKKDVEVALKILKQKMGVKG
ncbi:MAG: shikimate dehydrogenase [Parcubacteria group bacterium Gr01-1014_30]|nr:MAG: shikimate dehydrogenase [Parcubacteria group bacterium Gr01-1014_30]